MFRQPFINRSLLKPLETGIDLVFLGTSSAKATLTRNTSCIAFHYDFGLFLFDCGEGTARQLIQAPSINKGKINKVFITHLHGDHIYGLPGIITQTLQNKHKLEIYAPAGIKELLGERLFTGRDVKLVQIHKKGSRFERMPGDVVPDINGSYAVYQDNNIQIKASHIMHSVFSLGYVIEEKKKLKINVERLTNQYNFPPCFQYKEFAEGRDVEHEGRIIQAADVTFPPQLRKIVVLGDTCNPSSIKTLAMDADVLVHEATCENDEAIIALKSFHSTAGMAGHFANAINAKTLILTHFSPRNFDNVEDDESAVLKLVQQAQEQYRGKVVAAKDFLTFPVPKK